MIKAALKCVITFSLSLIFLLDQPNILAEYASVSYSTSDEPSSFSSTGSVDLSRFMEEYPIGGNDILEIMVYGEDELTQDVRVTSSGYITYPLLGRINVAGKSVVELEDFIHSALAKDYIRNPQVRVFVKEFSSIYVMGQVNEPGPYPFKGGMTVVQAITSAGGFTKIASKRNVRIVRNKRGNPESLSVHVGRIMSGKEEDTLLQPGDKIVVSQSFF